MNVGGSGNLSDLIDCAALSNYLDAVLGRGCYMCGKKPADGTIGCVVCTAVFPICNKCHNTFNWKTPGETGFKWPVLSECHHPQEVNK